MINFYQHLAEKNNSHSVFRVKADQNVKV